MNFILIYQPLCQSTLTLHRQSYFHCRRDVNVRDKHIAKAGLKYNQSINQTIKLTFSQSDAVLDTKTMHAYSLANQMTAI